MKESDRITVPYYKSSSLRLRSFPLKFSLMKDLKKKLARFRDEYPEANSLTIYFLFFFKLTSILRRLISAKFYLWSCNSIGRFVTTRGKPKVSNKGLILIGDRVAIWSVFDRTKFFVHPKAVLSIGAYSRINGVHISVKQSVTIGKRVRIGPYTLIMDSDFHDSYDRSKEGKVKPVTIEDDVWIASRVIILKGVTIGAGSMIAAGSVITHDIPGKAVAAGVPAKVIKYL